MDALVTTAGKSPAENLNAQAKRVEILSAMKEQNLNDQEPPRNGLQGAKTLVEYAYRCLRKDIIDGTLPPNSKLRIEHIRKHYQIGSSTMREALSLLVADALVTVEGQRGFRVSPISIEDLIDVTRMRKLMESMALRESIERGDDAWEAGIVAAFHRLSKVEERLVLEPSIMVDAWEACNAEFHKALIAACTSRWTLHFREILYYQSERYRRFSLMTNGSRRNVHSEHEEIMKAALARKADLACDLIDDHLDRTINGMKSILAEV